MAAPAAIPVLSDDREGVGLGLGVGGGMGAGAGVGGGVAVGVGVGASWACADVDANASAIAMASLRPARVLPKCGGFDEPRINIIPKKAQRKNAENHRRPLPICPQFFRSVNRSCPPSPAD
jgi:hypothetical protein